MLRLKPLVNTRSAPHRDRGAAQGRIAKRLRNQSVPRKVEVRLTLRWRAGDTLSSLLVGRAGFINPKAVTSPRLEPST